MQDRNRMQFHQSNNTVLFYGYDCVMPNQVGTYAFFSGCSSYTAKLTGLLGYEIAHSKEQKIKFEKLIENCNERLKRIDEEENKEKQSIEKEIESVVLWGIDSIYSNVQTVYDELNDRGKKLEQFNRLTCVQLLLLIDKKLNRKLDYKKFSVYDFDSVDKLVSKVAYCAKQNKTRII